MLIKPPRNSYHIWRQVMLLYIFADGNKYTSYKWNARYDEDIYVAGAVPASLLLFNISSERKVSQRCTITYSHDPVYVGRRRALSQLSSRFEKNAFEVVIHPVRPRMTTQFPLWPWLQPPWGSSAQMRPVPFTSKTNPYFPSSSRTCVSSLDYRYENGRFFFIR
jgi:hypothetical protein